MPNARARDPRAPRDAAAATTADRLHSVAIHLLRRLRREDDAIGLAAPRLSALSVVVYAGPISLGALAAAEQVRPPTMTRIVDALEADGLVARTPDPADRRVVRLRATPRGRRMLDAGRRRRVTVLAAALAKLPPADLAAVRRAIDILEPLVGRGSRERPDA